jgi:hypothetical protein
MTPDQAQFLQRVQVSGQMGLAYQAGVANLLGRVIAGADGLHDGYISTVRKYRTVET